MDVCNAVCREQLNDTTFVMVIPKSENDVNPENLSGAFLATVKKGYWEDMGSYNPGSSIRVNYGYELTGIVRAFELRNQFGLTPDDAEHSPVSDRRELYLINVTETSTPVRLGDVNEDGLVNIADVTCLIDYLLGANPQPFNELNADVDYSTVINIGDVTALIDILLSSN